MNKYLVIVESPGKIKKIQSFLGKGYKIIASYGHIIDLPKNKFSVDVKNDFKPTFVIMEDKKDVANLIKKESQKVDVVYIMSDGDREGAGIANNIYNIIKDKTKADIKRAKAFAITKSDVKNAIENSYDINDDKSLVDAYECRRVLDRCAGFKTSFLVQQATGGKSAGRVQSATLRMLADREKEIQAFIPKTYFDITAELITEAYEKIVARIKVPDRLDIKTEKQAIEICDTFKKGPVKVSKYKKEKYNSKPYPPFTTSSMMQSASSFLGMNSATTMKAAQSLYEQGLITYHRTDSSFIVSDFVAGMRSHISSNFGQQYLPSKPRFYSNKKNSQEAHEAIRPTDIAVKSAGSTASNKKLYDMIWKRAISSQMEDAVYWKSSAEFKAKKYVLSANGSECIFDGWRKAWGYSSTKDEHLPALKVGDEVKVIDIQHEECETKPPSRYSEASAIKKIEQLGIGRPSTYKSIFQTLETRKYIDIQKKSIHVSDLGLNVTKFLVESDFCFVDLGFTSDLEDKLDNIAQNKADKVETLAEFWKRLKSDIEKAKEVKKKINETEYDCPTCGKAKLVIKHSKFGDFLGCGNYPDCKVIYNIGENGEPVEKVKKELKESEHCCPSCGEKLIIRLNKKGGEYLGCRHWKKDSCKGFYNTDGEKTEFKKKSYKKKWKKKDV